FSARPDTGVGRVTLAGNPEIGEGVDQRLFDFSQIPVQILAMALEIDDRISHQLAGSVKCHVAAALDLEKLDAPGLQKLRRRDEMLFFRRAPECDNGRMLQQEQYVLRNCSGDSVTGKVALQLESLSVLQPSQRNHP